MFFYDSKFKQSILPMIKQKILSSFRLTVIFSISYLFYNIFLCPNILCNPSNPLLVIPKTITLEKLVDKLIHDGYIKNASSFVWTAYLLRYNPSNTPGLYQLKPNMSNFQAVKLLRSGRQTPVKLTFSTAQNTEDLVAQLTKRIGIDTNSLLVYLNDPKTLATYGFTPNNVLTMFIPNTYEVYWTITPEKLLSKMYTAYKNFWNDVRLKKLKRMGLMAIEASILASIVQSETTMNQEAMMIAGVYMNRLKRNMRIQSCPVLLYYLKTKNNESRNRLLCKDTHIQSDYNSYRKKGLPPGPITLPSRAMIDAVLDYTKHDYLYFSAKEDFSGSHYFTKDYQEHVRNANKYRRALNKKKIMR